MTIHTEIKKVVLAAAPMAGITDQPFRQLARHFGADWAVSEMVSDNPDLQHTHKTINRQNHTGEKGIIVVQIAGSQPEQMAKAAQYNVSLGAQVIDINMGCPAKKVCNVLAGSALLQNEPLVERILHNVVQKAGVPVTLKTRLGWDDDHKNILTIAKIAEQAGIAALAIHGRTRTQMYRGQASYDLIQTVKQNSNLPIWVNGDITSPQKAARILKETGADAVMIGRAAQGQPWLFADIKHFLQYGTLPQAIRFSDASQTALSHLKAIHHFYGDKAGVRIARKHIAWYLAKIADSDSIRKQINLIDNCTQQYDTLAQYFHTQSPKYEFWPRDYSEQ